MKKLRWMVAGLLLGLVMASSKRAFSQCAACAASVETNSKSSKNVTQGLNDGIFLLLAAPYLAVAICGYVWYKNYRRKNVDLNVPKEKLHLN